MGEGFEIWATPGHRAFMGLILRAGQVFQFTEGTVLAWKSGETILALSYSRRMGLTFGDRDFVLPFPPRCGRRMPAKIFLVSGAAMRPIRRQHPCPSLAADRHPF